MKIKNWSKFQHFKDRRPPWIKLYRDLLDDMQWHQLDPLASKVLVTLWLLASEDQDGCLPDTKTLAWRMRMTEKQILDCISKLSHWLEHNDDNLISERYQDDLPETEGETETKKETKAEKKQISNRGTRLPVDFILPLDWILFCQQERKDLIPEKVFAEFQDYWTALPAGKGTKADWTATWRNWVRRQSAPKQSFAQQAADIARTTVPAQHSGPDPVLLKIEADRQKAAPMPDHIRQQINQVLRKV
jgi:hypothetical protein